MWLLILRVGLDFTASIAAELFDSYARLAYFVVFIAVTVSIAYFVFRLASAIYGAGPAIVCLLLSAIPCLGTFAVLILNGNAIDQLRKVGIKVGFMGASAVQLEEIRASSLPGGADSAT